MRGLYRHVEKRKELIMPKPTREYCLAKIAELEEKIKSSTPEEALEYLVILENWRYLAERATDNKD